MTEGKLVKTKLEVEAKEYEQKYEYHGLLEVLYEEGQNKGYECARSYIVPNIIRAYLAGAEPREKRIVDLEAQIEKMKCCENCKYNSYWGNELHCNYGLKEALQEDKLVECKNMDKWEIKEK